MDAAEKRIRQGGYSGFSFRDIAADVGVQTASVHYHFPTKERLAAAVARRYTDRFLEAVDDIVRAWRDVFRASELSGEVKQEVKRFFELGIERLKNGGLSIHGIGIAVVPMFDIQRELDSELLHMPFGNPIHSDASYYAVYPQRKSHNANIILFRDWLVCQTKRQTPS